MVVLLVNFFSQNSSMIWNWSGFRIQLKRLKLGSVVGPERHFLVEVTPHEGHGFKTSDVLMVFS